MTSQITWLNTDTEGVTESARIKRVEFRENITTGLSFLRDKVNCSQ